MADTTHPLSSTEREQLQRWLVTEEGSEDWYRIRNARMVRVLLATGMHPQVLSNPKHWHLRIERLASGATKLLWNRPKTRAWVAPVIPDSMAAWIEQFLKDLGVGLHPVYITQLVQRAGERAGLIGKMTPRTLRHTFLRHVADTTRDISEVQRLGACSLKVALDYIRLAEGRYDEQFRKEQ